VAASHADSLLKDEVQKAFELCKKQYFDDYVMFWPLTYDAHRLPMAVFPALRQLAPAPAAAPQLEVVAAKARELEKAQVSIGRLSAEAPGTISACLGNARKSPAEITAI
jgi:hypothetical protein